MSGVCPQSCRAEGIPAAVKAGEAERREKPGGSISSWTPDVPGLSLDVSGGLWEAETKGFGRERVKWMRRTINKKIDEIIQFAGENQNRISYYTVADILKDREEQIDEKQLQEAMNLLNSRGIAVVQDGEDDESYPAEDAADSFIPADVNISQRNVNIYNLMERLENDEIELNPEFQRHKNYQYDESRLEEIDANFRQVMVRCSTLFGRLAFRKYRKNGRLDCWPEGFFDEWDKALYELI